MRFPHWLAVMLAAFLVHVAGTWSLPLIDRDEPRFAEASREMRASGDYVVPRFNGQNRFDKPPLIYWSQSAAFTVFGENEFAARLPSVLAAACVAGLLCAFGARCWDARTGAWAAIVFTLCPQTLYIAKAATADSVMVAFFTLAMVSGWTWLERSQNGDKSSRRWWWIFALALVGGFLTKGPVAWLPWLVVMIYAGSLRRADLLLKSAGALLVAAALVCAWAVPALMRTHGEYASVGLGKHVVRRALEPLEGHGAGGLLTWVATIPFYVLTAFAAFLPWSIWFPKAWRWTRDYTERRGAAWFLVLGIAAVFVPFSLMKTKLPHYTQPAFPLIALLWARFWFATARGERALIRLAGAGACVALAIFLLAFPFARVWFPSEDLFEKGRHLLKPEMEWVSVSYEEPSLVWSFRKVLTGWQRTIPASEAAAFMAKPGGRALILPTADVTGTFPKMDASWKSVQTSGLNIAKGRRADLTLLVKPE